MVDNSNRDATQEFAIFNVLVGHCGEMLTAAKVEKIRDELMEEIRNGSCSWAFKEKDNVEG